MWASVGGMQAWSKGCARAARGQEKKMGTRVTIFFPSRLGTCYEVSKIILILFKILILLYYTNDLICTTRFASLLHKSLLETMFF